MDKVQNGDINGDTYIKFGVSFSRLFDDESYYKKFVQGMLLYLRAAFKENYLFVYIVKNCLSLIHLLNNMLVDIKGVVSENHQKEISAVQKKKG